MPPTALRHLQTLNERLTLLADGAARRLAVRRKWLRGAEDRLDIMRVQSGQAAARLVGRGPLQPTPAPRAARPVS